MRRWFSRPALSVRIGSHGRSAAGHERTITRMRGTVKRSSRALSKSANVCYSALLMQVTAIEVTELALPDKQAGMKMAKAGLKMALGAIKLAVTMTPNKELLEGIQSAGKLGLEAYRRHAAVLASQLGCMATLMHISGSSQSHQIMAPSGNNSSSLRHNRRPWGICYPLGRSGIILPYVSGDYAERRHSRARIRKYGRRRLGNPGRAAPVALGGRCEGLSAPTVEGCALGGHSGENEPHCAYHFGGLSRMLSFGEENQKSIPALCFGYVGVRDNDH